MNLRLYSMAYPVTSLGPGERVAMWVAGCGQRCKGCISPEMLSTTSGRPVPVDTLVRRLLNRVPVSLAGVTVSGGEPFDQAGPLAALLTRLREERPHWNVLVYSGYTLAEIEDKGTDHADLLALVDILIDGPFRQEVPQDHPLAGSGNQRVHYRTARARALRAEIEAQPFGRVNYGLGDGGFDMLIGVVQRTPRKALIDLLRHGGDEG